MILSGGSTKSSITKLVLYSFVEDQIHKVMENTDNIGMMEINDINIQLKAGGSETGDGGGHKWIIQTLYLLDLVLSHYNLEIKHW